MYPKKELAQLVISACHQFNIDTVVISPGSRNAPLTVGFSNHPTINALSIVDERCAAFFALGIAQQTQKPVAIVCTSGSALLNYYPAIAEAFYSNIPLVVISADRPKHLIDIGDGQTIRQENVFQNHILFSANLIESEAKKEFNINLISEALQIAITKKGPIHINVPFDEPLYETIDELEEFTFPIVTSSESKQSVDYVEIAETWNASTKKMILVGAHFPDEELQGLIQQFKNDSSVIVLTETTSNIASETTINSIDKLIFPLSEEEFPELKPEVLLTFGGMVVSKKIKQFLRKHQPTHHWHIDEQKAMNTFHCLTEFIQEKPVTFLSALVIKSKIIESNYQQKWLREKEKRAEKHQLYLSEIPHADLKVFEQVLESIPANSQLQLGNSSVVRYAQLFDVKDSLKVFCNRGTSGIDGSTSTAIGAAFANKNQTVFITGDLSFFYDSNALWNNYIPKNFRIIIINNNGGGIFRFIPGPKSTNALEYFETPHQLTAAHLCKMYQLEYISVSETAKVVAALKSFYQDSNAPKVLEIFTDKEINETILKAYFNHLK
ncbi:2-succinyl-5-enolpyruvyl-6-hydroxy-3-cyclohexene-1-carboxylic-acid synthase [Polaribacter gochangensis]|uniref:2-succinyl-5-enolpyruvyl-6-hydroxy-3- cyclohexene-1-carboxylic-acid synthase n=1 Tax=Polaribacter gochangensis TaxID=3252903 RepID=UPI0039048B90